MMYMNCGAWISGRTAIQFFFRIQFTYPFAYLLHMRFAYLFAYLFAYPKIEKKLNALPPQNPGRTNHHKPYGEHNAYLSTRRPRLCHW